MNKRSIKNLGGPTDDGDATNKKYVDDKNSQQDIAINDKTSKKYVDDEMVKFSSIILGLGYNKNTSPSFAYLMNTIIHRNTKNFVFSGSSSSSLAYTTGGVNSTSLMIPNKGKYKMQFRDGVAYGTGNLKITLTSGNISKTIFEQRYNINQPGNYSLATTQNDLFIDNNDSVLQISTDGTLFLAGTATPNNPGYFFLYLDSDVLNQRVAENKYLKLDGSNKMGSDLDIDGNHILKVENLTDYKDTDPYDYRVKDVKSVVNKEYLNENFMKKVDKDGREYYDLKGNIIKNSQQYFDGLYTDDNDLVSKKYVDTENAKQVTTINNISSVSSYNTKVISALQTSKADQSYVDDNFLNLDGSKSMKGNLNTDGNYIDGLPELVEDDTSDETLAKIKGRAIDFGYFKKQRDYLLPNDGSKPLGGNLSMTDSSGNKHSIVGLKDPQPSDSSYAASVNFVNNTVNGSNVIINGVIDKKIKESEERSIRAVQQENVFEKVMVDDLFILDDDDIHKVAVVDKDFHKVNQETYLFKIDYDSSIGYYSTRLSVNVVYLPIGYYTIVFEMYCTDKIDQDKITVNALSGTLSVSKINTKKSSDCTRSVINFYKAIIYPSDDELDIDIALKNKAGQAYEADTQIYVVVYGVAGTQNDVDARLWDRYFYVDDKKIHFEAPIDMVDKDIENVNNLSINNELNLNNRPIKKLGDGIEDTDGVNVKQLNDLETKVTGEIGKVNPVLKNNSDFIKFIYRNLIRNDSKLFLIKELYFPDSGYARTQNNYLYYTYGDNSGDATFYLTFVHKATTSDNMEIAIHWVGLPGPIYIFVSKDKVETSRNLLIDDPSLASYNIPSYYQGKQVYLWITIQNDLIQINFSGSIAISGNHSDYLDNSDNIHRIYVSDSPFTIQRGLITKNIYDVNSNAYGDVREYEISEGTFVSAV